MNEVIRLWTDGPPTTIEGVPPEVAYTVQDGVAAGMTFYRNISDPTLTVFQPSDEAANGIGIIVVPGGGWTINAWGHEGLDVATWLTGLGHTVFVLKYRLQASPADPDEFETLWAAADQIHDGSITYARKPRAISDIIATDSYLQARVACADDGRRAVEVVRSEAERFSLRPDAIGMLGFSAGAFLIVDVALDPRADQVAVHRTHLRRRDPGRTGARRRATTVHRRRPRRHPRAHRGGLARGLGHRRSPVRATRVPPGRARVRHGASGSAIGRVDRALHRLAARPRARELTAALWQGAAMVHGDVQLPVIAVRPMEGRTGTTLLMQLLATSPEIVFDDRYPSEYRFLSYFRRLAELATEPFDERRHRGVTAFFFGDVLEFGPVPFRSDVIDTRELRDPLVGAMWGTCSTLIRQQHPNVRYYAEKLAVPVDDDLRRAVRCASSISYVTHATSCARSEASRHRARAKTVLARPTKRPPSPTCPGSPTEPSPNSTSCCKPTTPRRANSCATRT